jgi:hypothetical protein
MAKKKKKAKYKFTKNPDLYSDDFWYDLTSGGYLNPTHFSDDRTTIKAIYDAIALITTLQEQVDVAMGARTEEPEE